MRIHRIRRYGFLAIFVFGGAAPTAVTAAYCDKINNVVDELYCKNEIFSQVDNSLTIYYRALMKLINHEQGVLLKAAQREWVERRNHLCVVKHGGVESIDPRCAVDETLERTKFLNERYLECKSVGCLDYKFKYVAYNKATLLAQARMDTIGTPYGRFELTRGGMSVLLFDKCINTVCAGWAEYFADARSPNEMQLQITQDGKPLVRFDAVREYSAKSQFAVKVSVLFARGVMSLVAKDDAGQAIINENILYKTR